MNFLTHDRKRTAVLVAVLAGMAIIGGTAYAAIPASDGTVRGCYALTKGVLLGVPHSKGDVRIVDSGENCRGYETAITWNQQGPKGDKGDKGDPCLSSDPACRGPQGVPGEVGQTGPAGAPGSTTMWAVLDGDRMELVRGSHAVSFTRAGSTPHGFYLVTFDRNITECAFVGTAGAAHFGNPAGYNVTVGASAGEPTDVLVATRSSFNTLADTSFHLAVFC